ncbi:hypothetical protein [Crossiella sp. NPDC003009]
MAVFEPVGQCAGGNFQHAEEHVGDALDGEDPLVGQTGIALVEVEDSRCTVGSHSLNSVNGLPLIPLATAFRDRGHVIAFATLDGGAAVTTLGLPHLRRLGAQRRGLPPFFTGGGSVVRSTTTLWIRLMMHGSELSRRKAGSAGK